MEDFDELEDLESKSVKYDNHPWKKIIKTVLRHKKYAIGLLLSIAFLSSLDVLYPFFNQYALEHFFGDNPNYDTVPYFIASYIGIAFIYGFAVFLFLFFAGRVEVYTSYELRKDAFKNLQNLPFSYFDKTAQGWIMARLTSDARKLSEIISWGVLDFLWSFLTMIGILVVLMVVNIQLSLIILIVLPIILALTIFINSKILKAYRKARSENSKITAALNEGFMGAKATKSLVIEDKNNEEFVSKAGRYKRASLRAVALSSLFGPIVFVTCYFCVGTTIYVGASLAVSLPLLYLYVDYAIKFFDPVMNISSVLGEFKQAQASAERIISLIEEEADIKDSPEVIEKYGTIFNPKYENFEEISGDVEFKNVTFKYERGETVLKDFNLHVKAGSNVALVGHTGSGKSTIVNLICRFYEPTEGEILIDGKNYKDRSITWLHSNLGYVLQTPQLFTGTILENVKYGNLNATDEECIKALKMVAADEFIEKLDDKYNTFVGEGGGKLSLGEKQLISFARAIVKNPKILVLDEATSSIDTQTESKIQKAIDIAMEGRTSFMIAHRLSTVVNADLILVMKDGKIIESGNHHDLLKQKGYYFELYKNQFVEDSVNSLLV